MSRAEFNPNQKFHSILLPLIGGILLLAGSVGWGWNEFKAWMKYN